MAKDKDVDAASDRATGMSNKSKPGWSDEARAAAAKARGAHSYNPEAVSKQIASSSRHGPKIGGKEASLIHRLLKGRH